MFEWGQASWRGSPTDLASVPRRHGGSQARRGLLSSGGTSGSKSMSLDGQAAAEPAGQLEVTSPPPRQLGMAQPHEAAEPDSPPRAMLTPGAAALSSPFADWRPSFDFDLPPPPPFGKPGGGGGGGRCLEEDLGRLAHPSGGAAGKAAAPAAERDPRSQQEQHALENDENANWLISPARPPARAVPSMLQVRVGVQRVGRRRGRGAHAERVV